VLVKQLVKIRNAKSNDLASDFAVKGDVPFHAFAGNQIAFYGEAAACA
jgi:hypothetical protein